MNTCKGIYRLVQRYIQGGSIKPFIKIWSQFFSVLELDYKVIQKVIIIYVILPLYGENSFTKIALLRCGYLYKLRCPRADSSD